MITKDQKLKSECERDIKILTDLPRPSTVTPLCVEQYIGASFCHPVIPHHKKKTNKKHILDDGSERG